VSVARPESRGEVHIQSSDPYKPLRIDTNYFSDPEGKDMKVMLEGIHRALYLAENTTVFRNCDVKLAEKCFPGCENHIYRSLGQYFQLKDSFAETLD
jgi:choline dehydrogenase-like flavoprotein